jgi:hypothetical protein
MQVSVLALDLEGTLITDAMTQEPRAGLFDFLEFCLDRFERVVLFTCVEKPDALEILNRLADEGYVPRDFLDRLDYVVWEGEYKDLRFVAGARPEEVILIDDDPGWIHADQRGQWIRIAAWPSGVDDELIRVREVLERRLN